MAVLDASFLIDLEEGSDPALAALDRLAEDEIPMQVPAQAAAGYVAGFADPVANLRDLDRSYGVTSFGRDQVLETAGLAQTAFPEGSFPGWADLHVAAAAVLDGEVVVTADPQHFEDLPCRVWDYRQNASPPDRSSPDGDT